MISPKRNKSKQTGWEGFFPYYAGFPEQFARSIIAEARLSNDAVILDPWNGSGTTSYSAADMGYKGIGLDINPVMICIAKARMLSPSEADSLMPLAKSLVVAARRKSSLLDAEPLLSWFTEETAGSIRGIESAIRLKLVGSMTLFDNGCNLSMLSALAATYYVALFSVCRDLVRPFRSSNPTWLKNAKSGCDRIQADRKSIEEIFLKNIEDMTSELCHNIDSISKYRHETIIDISDSTVIYLDEESVDLVLTSPPYCTRLDYTSATRVELAVIRGLVDVIVGNLSKKMIGSVRVPDNKLERKEYWGKTCMEFLQNIYVHPSKASKTYYYNTHLDYFDKMDRSIYSISRVLKPGGDAVLVVQDSYYKDVYNNLPMILIDMAMHHGLSCVKKDDFHVKKSMAGINQFSRKYIRKLGATESVVFLKKGR